MTAGRMPILRIGLLFGALPILAAFAENAAAEPLGRLFFTPERRAALERQRQLNIQEAQTLEGATMTLDGVVVRSTGKRTVWINSRAQHDDDAPSGVTADLSAREPGGAILSVGEETPAQLKVGESINRATRETASGLADGQISVRRPSAPARK
ncbi:MAG: hypothetical protein OHM77_06850 [Candidatus Nitricoxidivorans perseverans]|uniref:DUF5666 domain-containing protein n=1 Tax=Candidatus Nitricoxidivorans perseverans TaxID=2975601 RepID=A0AA49FNB5_9PROT|nr:MAG: hypothetical protein OHM77_06850 [Candidatus Nitricoxidivorans perseverans]